jgi:hypothetical protein
MTLKAEIIFKDAQTNLHLFFFGRKFVPYWWMKIYPKRFRPKLSFV